ncbi:MAG: DUF58 domain-containing protein [Phycisphaerae bacterium]|nr:DUF58 domain-containing protein [Phycisphaerae bacterium]
MTTNPHHTRHSYIDPVLLSKLANMEMVARCAVEGFYAGLHPSPFRGFSVEYSDHRAYQKGDELKYLDWKKYGRSDKLVVKQFQQETNVNVYILLDTSHSMSFGDTDVLTKQQYASFLAASLCYLMLKQNDGVALALFNESIRTWIPPRSRSTHLHVLLTALQQYKPQGRTALADVLHTVAERTHRRGIVILISDLLDDRDDIRSGLSHLKYLKHDVIVFQILDRQELELDFEGQVQFEDLESDTVIRTFPQSIRSTYRDNVQAYLAEIQDMTGRSDIDYRMINTAEALDKALLAYLNRRKRLG